MRCGMTVTEIIREILVGICPRSEIGHIMAMIALDMIYEGVF